MQSKAILFGIIGFLVGSLLTVLVVSNAVNNNNQNIMQMMGMRSNQMANSNTIDAHFIEQMIPHHEDAIIMAKLAQTKAKTPEIKQLAENIITSQGQEIDQMRNWYKNWFGREVPENIQVMNQHGMMGGSSMHMGKMGSDMDMTRLEESSDFDKAFIEEMIPHHQMAVMMAQMLENSTSRPEMKNLAKDIISAQTKEINEMRSWYQSLGY